MSWIWIIFAFIAGWFFCWWFGGFILRHTLAGAGPTMKKAVSGLPQDSLLKVYATAADEIEKRKTGLSA